MPKNQSLILSSSNQDHRLNPNEKKYYGKSIYKISDVEIKKHKDFLKSEIKKKLLLIFFFL